MSLQIWLPLNGNLENKGLLNLHSTIVTQPTYSNIGKIGNLSLSAGTLKISGEDAAQIMSNQAFSISFWVYINADTGDTTKRQMFFGNDSPRRFSVFQYPNCNSLHLSWQNGTSYVIASVDNVLPSYKWTHVAITYGSPKCKVYINGEVIRTGTFTFNNSDYNVETYLFRTAPSNGRFLNDYRIYNHCLSTKEVKEISKGLVLHYPFSEKSQDNLMPNSYIMNLNTSNSSNASIGQWRLAGSSTMTRNRVQIDNNFYAFQNNGTQTADDGSCYGIDSFPFETNTQYTISMYARIIDGNQGYAGFHIYNANINNGNYEKIDKRYYVKQLTNKWQQIWVTFTTDSNTNRNIYIGITTGTTNVTTQMALIKIEKGNKVTSWCPKATDAEYIKFGFNNNIIPDCSGYENNATGNFNLIYNEDSPRYNGSLYFNGSSQYLTLSNTLGTSFFNNDFTYSVWLKPTDATRGIILSEYAAANSSNVSFELTADLKVRIWWNSSPDFQPAESKLTQNVWNHVAIVKSTNQIKIYVNGVLKSTYSGTLAERTTSTIPRIGDDYRGGTAVSYQGYMSDFRVYATALTAQDIKELYNAPISVDNQGNCYVKKLVEEYE